MPGFQGQLRYGFEMVDARKASVRLREAAINQKFTPNRINRIFREFSAISPQCRHLRFIDGC
jgi:hypothetical protein